MYSLVMSKHFDINLSYFINVSYSGKMFQSAYDTIQIYDHQIWCFSVLSLRYCKPDSVKFIAEMGHKQSGLRTMEYSLDVEKTNKEKVTIYGLISISILKKFFEGCLII